jgi:hypothetical protein
VLVFEPNDAAAVTLSEGYVTVNPGNNYIELTTSLPAYLKNTGDHSWVIQFRLFLNNGYIRLALTTSPSSKRYLNFTGVLIYIVNDTGNRRVIKVTYYKGPGISLVDAFYAIPTSIDLSIGIHQIVTTYNESTRTLNLYFDDKILVTSVASSTDPIVYEVSSSIVLNKIDNWGNRDERTEYHKVACYDKILTQSEVIDLYTNTNTFTNANMATIDTVSNIAFSSLEPETSYVIQLTDFVHNPLNSPGSRLQYTNFPTSVSLLTGKFSAPTINDPAYRTSNIIHVGFTPPADDELPGYLTRKSLDKQFEAKFSVASTEHNQSDIIKYLDYSDVVTGTSTVPIDGLLPNTLYTITLTGFGYETLNTIPYITFVQSSVNTLYTSTDNMVLTYDSVTHNIVDDDGDVTLTFTNIRATYDTSYMYNAYIFINGTEIGTISDIGSFYLFHSSFTTVSDPAIPYYDSGANPPLTIKFRNMSFTNNPYVKENRTSVLPKVIADTQLIPTGGVTIIITVETIVLNANENIVITMASAGNTLLPDVGTFKPNDLYRFKYTVSYE